MLRSTRLIGYAAALALSVISTAALATVVLNVPSLTGSVVATNFADGTPNTFNVSVSHLNGTVTAVALPKGNYTVSGQGFASFTNNPGSGLTTNIPIVSPLTLFTGALSSSGITTGTYNATFIDGNHALISSNVNFTVNYDGQTSQQVLDLLNALIGAVPPNPVYVDPHGAGSLLVTGSLYRDGFDFSFTESNLNWTGFGGLLSTIDQMEGGDNGTIDGTFALRNVVVTAAPEPAPLALIGLALASLAWVRRRRS